MRYLLLSIFTFLGSTLFSQAPALIPYQAVARDASGQALNGATINARFTLHDGTATGSAVWQELQTVTTSALGLFTAQLGSSVPLTGVNWANGSKFMQVEIDLGQGFVDIGTQQMLSVPYALHAGSVSLNVSASGDTLFLGDNNFVLIPGISEANVTIEPIDFSAHTCGQSDVHNQDVSYGELLDQEGNVYKTIIIGTQEWMAENLNTSSYQNGDLIASNVDNAAWSSATNGSWVYYSNGLSNECPFGKLYNWYACVDSRGLCPSGWHMPSDAEWTTLTTFLGGEGVAGGKLKSVGTLESSSGLWSQPNSGATNFYGFSAVPAGFRGNTGNYLLIDDFAGYWSSTSSGSTFAYYRSVNNSSDDVTRNQNSKLNGFSVRCLRD